MTVRLDASNVDYAALGDDSLRSLAAGATAELARRKAEAARCRPAAEVRLAGLAQRLLRACAWCRKVQDDRQAWRDLEGFVNALTGMKFTHGICPDCLRRHRLGSPDGE